MRVVYPIVLIAALLSVAPAQQDLVYTVAPSDPNLRIVDVTTRLTLSSTPITTTGASPVMTSKRGLQSSQR